MRLSTRVFWILMAGALALFGDPVVGQSNERAQTGAVGVRLVWEPARMNIPVPVPTPRYDPLDPEGSGVLSLVIENGTNRVISVPAKYDGRVLRLCGKSAGHRFPLYLWNRKRLAADKPVEIAPGKRHTCFSLPLSEILSSESLRKEQWRWDWRAHPAPPLSPIHHWADDARLLPMAVFWAEVVLDHQSLRTEPVIVEVRSKQTSPIRDRPAGGEKNAEEKTS